MRARVTNLCRSARGFHTADGGTALVEPAAAADLDLADHPAHDAWAAAGEVEIAALPQEEPPAKPRSSVRAPSRARDV